MGYKHRPITMMVASLSLQKALTGHCGKDGGVPQGETVGVCKDWDWGVEIEGGIPRENIKVQGWDKGIFTPSPTHDC